MAHAGALRASREAGPLGVQISAASLRAPEDRGCSENDLLSWAAEARQRNKTHLQSKVYSDPTIFPKLLMGIRLFSQILDSDTSERRSDIRSAQAVLESSRSSGLRTLGSPSARSRVGIGRPSSAGRRRRRRPFSGAGASSTRSAPGTCCSAPRSPRCATRPWERGEGRGGPRGQGLAAPGGSSRRRICRRMLSGCLLFEAVAAPAVDASKLKARKFQPGETDPDPGSPEGLSGGLRSS